MTQERDIIPAKMDENYTLMAKTKDRWQNLKEFKFQRKKTAGRLREGLSSSSNIHERQDKCKAVRQAILAVSNAIKR